MGILKAHPFKKFPEFTFAVTGLLFFKRSLSILDSGQKSPRKSRWKSAMLVDKTRQNMSSLPAEKAAVNDALTSKVTSKV